MDDSSSGYLLLMVFLLLLDTLITIAYAALQNARQSDLQEQADEGKGWAKTALTLLDAKSKLYITYTVSTTLLNFAIAVIATITFVIPAFADTINLSRAVAVLIVMLIGAVVMIVGNIVPEAIGSAYAKPLVRLLTLPLHWFTVLLTPLTLVMVTISSVLARLFGSDKLVNTVTEEEIMTLVSAGHTGGAIEVEEKEMIYSILQLDETYAREMMIPRIDMVAMSIDTPIDEAIGVFNDSGYSRVPVYDETIDNIVGLAYAKDVLKLLNNGGLEGHSIRDLIRSAHFIPETLPARKLLRDLQSRKVHMAIVVDEYGGTAGLVTIENIIEEIVGDIRDEYDTNEEGEYIKNSETEYIIDAGMDIDDINDLLGISISSDDTDTLGGYIYLMIGRVPIVGEVIETDEITMTVRSIDGRRIRKVLVTLKPHVLESSDKDKPEQVTDTDEAQEQTVDAT
ncbi:MAG: hemolysin family protein [Anaerolineae bacterium]|nr:hemolysin family protein [Anaerolineae bacterium]MDQ7035082.1 hemolysin family protein [Anaerolineae bacterium]